MKRMVSRSLTRWRKSDGSKEGGRRRDPEKEMKVRKETERSSMQVWNEKEASKKEKKKKEGGQVEVFFSLDPSYRRGRVYKLKFCLFVCLSVRHHFNISVLWPSNHPRIMSDPTYYIPLDLVHVWWY